jgi:hypothetical protein
MHLKRDLVALGDSDSDERPFGGGRHADTCTDA